MSITTGFWNFCRNSVAILAANTTASGSSPFAWKIGASIILATSDGRARARVARIGREADLIVDDEVHRAADAMPRRPERPKLSAITPWPANEASPGISSGMTMVRSSGVAPYWSCLARTLPSTTGLTISRCDGLAVSERCTLLPSNSRSDEAPRWYFTSPEPSTSSGFDEPPLNSWKIARCGLPMTWESTLSRPRCAMPRRCP